jgi:hypothetical protein
MQENTRKQSPKETDHNAVSAVNTTNNKGGRPIGRAGRVHTAQYGKDEAVQIVARSESGAETDWT